MNQNKLLLAVLFLGLLTGLACAKPSVGPTSENTENPAEQKSAEPELSHYTCPMHPQVHDDHPGDCPICHMKLVPVYLDTTGPKDKDGGASVTISAPRQQLVGIETLPAVKKNLVKEIRASGRVAFDPDLAIAQQEYLEIRKNVPALIDAARSRLRLLGMTEAELAALDKTKKTTQELYLPKEGDSVWIYATLFGGDMELVKAGQSAKIYLPSGDNQEFNGTVMSLDPVVSAASRSLRARIEVPSAGGRLKPDSYVNVSIQVDLGLKLTIPKSAVLFTGARKLAFVKRPEEQFQTREIKTGSESNDDIEIVSGINEGENVVARSAFLVDAETQLRAAVTQSAPSCPEGEAWDAGMAMCMPNVGQP